MPSINRTYWLDLEQPEPARHPFAGLLIRDLNLVTMVGSL